jgi:hypothetical protein
MNRTWLLLMLLTTGIALADDPPAKPAPPAAPAKRPDGAAKAEPAKKDAEPAKKEAEPAKNEAEGAAKPEADDKTKHDADLGMSILGNQEAPKSLVIVPWKSSEIGQGLGISTLLDDSRQPIDKEVFMRVLSYYELTTTTTHRRKP